MRFNDVIITIMKIFGFRRMGNIKLNMVTAIGKNEINSALSRTADMHQLLLESNAREFLKILCPCPKNEELPEEFGKKAK